MNSNHLSVPELAKFLDCHDLGQVAQTAPKVNSHILSCPSCRALYDTMLTAKDSVEEARRLGKPVVLPTAHISPDLADYFDHLIATAK